MDRPTLDSIPVQCLSAVTVIVEEDCPKEAVDVGVSMRSHSVAAPLTGMLVARVKSAL